MIAFLALFGVLQIVNSGLFSVVQSNIVSNCSFAMSVDNIWLAETCVNATNMYKFTNGVFIKLPYTIPLTPSFSVSCQISVNAYGNFIAQTRNNLLLVYNFNDTWASPTPVLNKTFSGYNYVVISIATNETTMMYAAESSAYGATANIGFLKYNGSTYISHGGGYSFSYLTAWFI